MGPHALTWVADWERVFVQNSTVVLFAKFVSFSCHFSGAPLAWEWSNLGPYLCQIWNLYLVLTKLGRYNLKWNEGHVLPYMAQVKFHLYQTQTWSIYSYSIFGPLYMVHICSTYEIYIWPWQKLGRCNFDISERTYLCHIKGYLCQIWISYIPVTMLYGSEVWCILRSSPAPVQSYSLA